MGETVAVDAKPAASSAAASSMVAITAASSAWKPFVRGRPHIPQDSLVAQWERLREKDAEKDQAQLDAYWHTRKAGAASLGRLAFPRGTLREGDVVGRAGHRIGQVLPGEKPGSRLEYERIRYEIRQLNPGTTDSHGTEEDDEDFEERLRALDADQVQAELDAHAASSLAIAAPSASAAKAASSPATAASSASKTASSLAKLGKAGAAKEPYKAPAAKWGSRPKPADTPAEPVSVPASSIVALKGSSAALEANAFEDTTAASSDHHNLVERLQLVTQIAEKQVEIQQAEKAAAALPRAQKQAQGNKGRKRRTQRGSSKVGRGHAQRHSAEFFAKRAKTTASGSQTLA